ncbi:lysophospholipid acyltransferase family protein [Shouchella lonarensis]|uniref:1-acyl-sn-glycerol-3-phosphate acyltransferase n=1 Tax=Shouchella lonarensis TaxID=1464122 RepID=A0A1G6J0Z3_9BACI|nr:lysophospholipid acyltransferase family protein [Shouchella lonarensis]SDC12253.1 1-acyl-sn-glycerol-3-phosphate acyltransferase [Shouchella lonarensis]
MSLYRTGQVICKSFFNISYKVQVIGQEHIPKEGGVLLCCNHLSNLDPPLLGAYLQRPVHYMAKKELFEVPLFGTLLSNLGAFPVKRGAGDRQALRTTLNMLKEGKMIGLFPEGTRSKTGEIGEGLAGVGFFAARSEAAVVPVAIIGPYKFRKPLTIVYGKPLDMQQLREQKASAAEVTAVIMTEIKQLKARF